MPTPACLLHSAGILSSGGENKTTIAKRGEMLRVNLNSGWNNPLPIGQAKGAAPGESELHLGHARIIVFPVAGPARGHSS